MSARRGSDPANDDSHLAERESALREAVERLADKVKSGQVRTAVLTASVVLDLALTGGFFVANSRTNDAVRQVEALVADVADANASQRAACLSSNEDRDRNRALWEWLLTVPRQEGQPPPDPKVLAELDVRLDEAFVQQDCEV